MVLADIVPYVWRILEHPLELNGRDLSEYEYIISKGVMIHSQSQFDSVHDTEFTNHFESQTEKTPFF